MALTDLIVSLAFTVAATTVWSVCFILDLLTALLVLNVHSNMNCLHLLNAT